MKALAMIFAALALAGCAVGPLHLHRGHDSRDHLEFLLQALTSDPSRRETLWQATLKEPPGSAATLHRALLRTVPGHTGYDVVAAEAELQALLSQSPPADIAQVARARLEDTRAASECENKVKTLTRRLSKVVDIERRLDQERR